MPIGKQEKQVTRQEELDYWIDKRKKVNAEYHVRMAEIEKNIHRLYAKIQRNMK